MPSPKINLDPETTRLLNVAVDRSKRTKGVQLMDSFARSTTGIKPPLSDVMRGGQGGAVRLKLYLCITLIATSKPFNIKRPIAGEVWAAMIGLEKPETQGARRIGDSLTWLEENKLLSLDRKKGRPPLMKLLHSSGDGTAYSRPANHYISLPLGIWREGWIASLSGRALALLIVLLELQGGVDPAFPPYLGRDERDRYGLSDDTWSRATKELVQAGILQVGRVTNLAGIEWTRARNTYWVNETMINQP